MWNVSGHVQFRVISTGAINAVISGLLFGIPVPAKDQFVKLDTTTQGTWKGVYGTDGYNVIGNTPSYPAYVVPLVNGTSMDMWAANHHGFARIGQDRFGPRCSHFVQLGPSSLSTCHSANLGRIRRQCTVWIGMEAARGPKTLHILDANNSDLI